MERVTTISMASRSRSAGPDRWRARRDERRGQRLRRRQARAHDERGVAPRHLCQRQVHRTRCPRPPARRSLTSRTMPTTSRIASGKKAVVSRCPIGSSPGQSRLAIASLTSATAGAPCRSASVKSRPRTIGMRIVRRYPGVMRFALHLWLFRHRQLRPPAIWTGQLLPEPLSGRTVTIAGRLHAGQCPHAARPARRRSAPAVRARDSVARAATPKRSARRADRSRGRRVFSSHRLRISRPAPMSSTSDSATSTMTSVLRTRDARPHRTRRGRRPP